MRTHATSARFRITALALIATAGVGYVAFAAPHDDHATPSHDPAPSHAPAKVAPKPAPKQTPKAPAAKQLAPSGHDDPHAPSAAAPADHAPPAPKAANHAAPANDAPTQAPSTPSASAEPTGPLTPDQVLALLNEGNQRWVSDKERNPNSTPQRREQTAAGQNPFVTILTCADSRLPVERIFDRGVGDVFVIRVAGNVAGQSETGTIEYGVEHLKTPVLVVMGHTKCGAVAAAASGAQIHGALGSLVDHIRPAVDRAKNLNPDATPEELAATAVRENVWQTIFDLYSSSPELRSRAADGSLKVVGAIYDIKDGNVEWIGEHPWQREIITALNVRNDNASPVASPVASHDAKPVTPVAKAAPVAESHNAPADAHAATHAETHADAQEGHDGH